MFGIRKNNQIQKKQISLQHDYTNADQFTFWIKAEEVEMKEELEKKEKEKTYDFDREIADYGRKW